MPNYTLIKREEWRDLSVSRDTVPINFYCQSAFELGGSEKVDILFEARADTLGLVVRGEDAEEVWKRIHIAVRHALTIEWRPQILVSTNAKSHAGFASFAVAFRRVEMGIWHDGTPVYRDRQGGVIVFPGYNHPPDSETCQDAFFDDTLDGHTKAVILVEKIHALRHHFRYLLDNPSTSLETFMNDVRTEKM